ncbi:MAG: 1-deoxy-D-xylulose-5-phosphate reductoisomerase [Pseudomonadota bacterium]|nr:1-deoxy-D-xylulose-5-phosphate reductoisomerase [Pseudomonadota bacterium]
MKGVVVLGATGSVGRSTLDVLARHADRFRVVALTANRDVDAMAAACRAHRPQLAVMADPAAAQALAAALPAALGVEIAAGAPALAAAAADPRAELVMAAIVGGAGLVPTMAAVQAGRRVLLANKEALVMAGGLMIEAARRSGASLLPIDSEHNAIFQCLPRATADGADTAGVAKITLTASGGPFRDWPAARIASAGPAAACAHPTWQMGRKISVDSASLMNKGLETIEAHWLFGLPPSRIDVVVHPQSVVHSLVSYVDGSVLAQLGNPDMRTPIAHALGHPERLANGVAALDLCRVGRLDFEPPDEARFPCLRLAREAMTSPAAAVVLNAANEVAVGAFLEGRLDFPGIADCVAATLDVLAAPAPTSLDEVRELDHIARQRALELVPRRGR